MSFSDQATAKLQQFSEWGYAKLPVCIAKTQYSFTDDPKVLGAPTRLDFARDGCVAFGGGGICSGHRREYDAHARTTQSFARGID